VNRKTACIETADCAKTAPSSEKSIPELFAPCAD